MKGVSLLIFFFFSLFAAAQKIRPENPDMSPGNFRQDPLPPSEINIPIQVNLRPLYTLAERAVDTLFTSPNYPDDWVQEGCGIRYKYSFRRSKLQLKAAGNALTLGFTGYYRIVGATRACINGTVVSPWTPACRCGFGDEPERRVNVSFTNSLTIQPDFKLKLAIKRNEPQPLDKCEVCFWGQDITGQVMKGLVAELDAAKKDLDRTYGTVDLRGRFQQVWNQLGKVYNIYGLGWLSINPQQFRINNFYASNDSLTMSIGLSALPVISFERPAELPTPVPNLGSFARSPGFTINLDARLRYDSLSRLLNGQLAGKTFDFKKGFVKKKFVVEDCSIYGGGFDKMVIKINFSGTNDGVVYLVGRPVYDTASRVLQVTDIDFDIKSKNVLLGSADWLFDKKITREIGKYARFELGAYIDTAQRTINQELNKEWAKGIRSNGLIHTISLAGIYPLQEYLLVRSTCTGTLAVKVESVNFSL